MPYGSIQDLPLQVRENLPPSAQRVDKAAFNNAWDEYATAEDQRGDAGQGEVAHKVAWYAVKQRSEKEDGGRVHANSYAETISRADSSRSTAARSVASFFGYAKRTIERPSALSA